MKCVLINLRGGVRNTGPLGCANIFEPLGLEYLAAFIEKSDPQIQAVIVHQIGESYEQILERVIAEAPDVVGFSVLTATLKPSLEMAERLKGGFASVQVVFGGDHPSGLPDVVKHPQVDFVIVGEGETAFVKLVEALRGKREIESVPSIFYKQADRVCSNTHREFVDLPELPRPKRDPLFLMQARVGGMMYPNVESQRSVAVVAATRGCPFNCSFCNNGLMWQCRIRYRDPKDVVEEINDLSGVYGTNTVFFADLTFNASRDYVVGLCEELVCRDLPVHWYAMCNINMIDADLCARMASAKCSKLGFGIESFIPETMHLGKGRISKDLNFTNDKLRAVNNAGIFSKAYLIIGFPWETQEMYDRLCKDMETLEAHELRIGYYVPFPGTDGYERDKALIDEWDFDKWSSLEMPVVRNRELSKQAIMENQRRLYKSFYTGESWERRMVDMASKFPRLETTISAFIRNRGC